MSTPPVPRGQLPPLPKGAQVTAWKAGLPDGATSLSPRMAMVLLLHASWLRWLEYAAMLERQLSQDAPPESGGLVGHTMASGRGGLYATGEQVRALAVLEGEERDRVMRYARQCHDVGLLGDDW